MEHPQHRVDREADDEAHDHLEQEDRREPPQLEALRQADGDQLVRGREDHGDERADRDDAAGVERGGHRREAALRKRAQKAADDGPELAGRGDDPLHPASGGVLDRLHRQVGEEEEGQEFQGVDDAVEKNAGEEFQSLILT